MQTQLTRSRRRRHWFVPLLAVTALGVTAVQAIDPVKIGLTALNHASTNLNGSGVSVAHVEALIGTDWEVNPSSPYVNQPVSLFTYTSSAGTTNVFPNSLGTASGHANTVASNFYGFPWGVATNVAHVDNYEAGYFVDLIYSNLTVNGRIANQSWIFADNEPDILYYQAIYDPAYDYYAAKSNVLFVSGVGNGYTPISPPSTCYNGMGVGVYGQPSTPGPTLDNGRAKPDIVAPELVTSYSTPIVAGAAALLMQAGTRGDGGADTNSATDIRTIKALLMNGAVKPSNWARVEPSPLDFRYGAGIVNVFNSYQQLIGQKRGYTISETLPAGDPHPPTGDGGSVAVLSGWDYSALSSTMTQDAVNHYYFDVTNAAGDGSFMANATLVWHRQDGELDINDLNLFLYETGTSNLVYWSTSIVDNVEHLFVPALPAGRYDLQVFKAGGPGRVSNSETYALAFEFVSAALQITPGNTNAVVTWPLYPAGFVLQANSNLAAHGSWANYPSAPVITNGVNQVIVSMTGNNRFFRLRRIAQ